ncbi:hypothetical protein EDF62_0054 [Leucobacter luti]|uniref:Uncharacterized protein n=1 Tax=Leucobacter luti TaxID=340320 RepID=A0A4R6S6P8_9MICO|nr:hypothetical protein EDF62_0054 [Leucobacter luti]
MCLQRSNEFSELKLLIERTYIVQGDLSNAVSNGDESQASCAISVRVQGD